MVGSWTRESRWATGITYALFHAMLQAPLCLLLVFAYNPSARGWTLWLAAPPVLLFFVTLVWLMPRVDAMLALQALVDPGYDYRASLWVPGSLYDLLWSQHGLNVILLELRTSLAIVVVALGAYAAGVGRGSGAVDVLIGAGIAVLGVGSWLYLSRVPAPLRPVVNNMRRYVRSRAADKDALHSAADDLRALVISAMPPPGASA